MNATIDRLNTGLAGRYRIERELGAGGMATVYLARDERHARNVALKVLRPELAAVIGADRFLVEIKTTANLQHPNILPLHDSGELNGTVWYVMPLIEGESLRDRLTRETQLPIEDALEIAREVASALDYAHRHGVVHRDIKPENILLHDGRAVVADFGIALAVSRTDRDARLTETGMSLGTPHYMSPEQALGERNVDARADVYALGAVLYEMLTGEPPFTGPTAQAIIAKVMNAPPTPIAAARPTVPAAVDAAVIRALAKLPADRFRSAADFAAALQSGATGAAAQTSTVPAPGKTQKSKRAKVVNWLIVAVVLALVFFLPLKPAATTDARVTAAIIPLELRTPTNLPLNEAGVPFGISPDGSFIVFTGPDPGGVGSTAIWIRHLDALIPTPIPGTQGGQQPIVSGDGKTVQFLVRAPSNVGNLRWEVGLDGGMAQKLPIVAGMRRLRDGSAIVTVDSALVRIAAGQPIPEARGGVGASVVGRTVMDVSPDGQWVARSRRRGSRDSVVLQSIDGDQRFPVAEGVSPIFLDNDLLAFGAPDGTLQVGRLSRDRRTLVAPPMTVLASVARAGDGNAMFAVSRDGTLIYAEGGSAARSRPVWIAGGHEQPIPGVDSRIYGGGSISLDGRRAAVTTGVLTGPGGEVSVIDLVQGSMTPLTSDGLSSRPVWMRDGKRVSFVHALLSTPEGRDAAAHPVLFARNPDSGAPADSMTARWSGGWIDESDWSPDGQFVAFRTRGNLGRTTRDVFVWRVGTDSIVPFATEAAQERGPRFSPDGKALLYVSDRSGRDEVWTESFPGGGNRTQISLDGGREGTWSRDGSKIFYRSTVDGWMVAASISRGTKVEVTNRARLFDASAYLANQFLLMYDVAPDGRFLMFKLDAQRERTDVVIIRNWERQVKARLANRN